MTIATMHSHQAHQLLTARGPFASIYFDDSHDGQDGAARLEVKWRDIAEELEDHGAETALVSLLERAVLGAKPPVGRSGHGLIATADGVLIDEHLVVAPPSPVVRVSDLPYVVPLIECGPVSPTYMVVAVDHVGADLILYQGNTVLTETVDAGGYPLHKVANAENYGWGAQEHRVEEAIRKNVRAVADALSRHFDRDLPEIVFVIGQDRVRAELMLALPERVKVRVVRPRVGARNTGVDDTVCRAIALEFQSRRLAVATEVGATVSRRGGPPIRRCRRRAYRSVCRVARGRRRNADRRRSREPNRACRRRSHLGRNRCRWVVRIWRAAHADATG